MRPVVVSVLGVIVVMIAALLYVRVGWDRMVSECDLSGRLTEKLAASPEGATGGSFSVSFSLQFPRGFTCTYSDGTQRSSYWF